MFTEVRQAMSEIKCTFIFLVHPLMHFIKIFFFLSQGVSSKQSQVTPTSTVINPGITYIEQIIAINISKHSMPTSELTNPERTALSNWLL